MVEAMENVVSSFIKAVMNCPIKNTKVLEKNLQIVSSLPSASLFHLHASGVLQNYAYKIPIPTVAFFQPSLWNSRNPL